MATTSSANIIDSGSQTLKRESDGRLLIVDGDKELLIKEEWGDNANTWLESKYEGGNYRNVSEAVAVEALSGGGYQLVIRQSNNNDVSSGEADRVSWSVYRIDSEGHLRYGVNDPVTGQWVNFTLSGLKSPQSFEATMGQDLNGDGVVGLNQEAMVAQVGDAGDVRLTRDSDGALYIQRADGSLLSVPNSGYWDQKDSWTNGYYQREALAVEATHDDQGALTGYMVAIKVTSQNGDDAPKVSFDVYALDVNGQQVYNDMYPGSGSGSTQQASSAYGLKSLLAHETVFQQDFNGDGTIGISAASLTEAATDTIGAKLARDASGGLYIVDGNDLVVLANGSNWEYKNAWNNDADYDQREALAVERVEGSDGALLGYTIAIKKTSKYGDNAEQVSYDVYQLDTKGQQVYGYNNPTNGMWVDPNKYGIKSIAELEPAFKQDLNNDGAIGLNTDAIKGNTLATDTSGAQLARDGDGALYVVDGESVLPLPEAEQWEQSYNWGSGGESRQAVAIESVRENGELTGYRVIVERTYTEGTDVKVSYDIYGLDAQGHQQAGMMGLNGMWQDPNVYGVKSLLPYEEAFGEDFNGDTVVGLTAASVTPLTSDITGAKLARDASGGLYIVDGNDLVVLANGSNWEYKNAWNNDADYDQREALAVERVEGSDGALLGYTIAIKKTSKYGDNAEQVSYDVYQLDTKGQQVYGYNNPTNGMWVDPNKYGIKSIAALESEFQQDLNNDGSIGLTTDAIKDNTLDTDTLGAQLARDEWGGLYIVEGNSLLALPEAGNWEYDHSWDSGFNRREALAVEKVMDGSTLKGYTLAMRTKVKDSNDSAERVTYDIYSLDTSGKQVFGATDASGMWRDANVYGAASIAPFEKTFGEDLDGDGAVGVDVSTLNQLSTDGGSTILARDSDGGLYAIHGESTLLLPNAQSWEYQNNWGNDINEREAVAIEAVLGQDGTTITGYKVALKSTQQWGSQDSPQVSYDIYTLDVEGRQTWGSMQANGMWQDGNVYGAKSLTAYEVDFAQDFDQDGVIGVNLETIEYAKADEHGLRLARANDGNLFVVDTVSKQSVQLPDTQWWEYENDWGNGYNKREAIAIEGVKDNADALIGYRLVLKQVNKNGDQAEQITYDIYSLDLQGRQTYGKMDETGMWRDDNVYGAKSLTPYEQDFGEDFNGDDILGVNVGTLTSVDKNPEGVRLARDPDGALYAIKGSDYLALPNSGWWEYSNAWDMGSNTRTALAIVAFTDGANSSAAYKVAFKQVNEYDGQDKQVTYDVYTLDDEGRQLNGQMGSSGEWKDSSVYGIKTLAPYEQLFGEDFNADGVIGVDRNALQTVASDTEGPTLARDGEGALYLVPDGSGDPIGVSAGWLEYSNSWGANDYNKREAFAVTSLTDGSTVTGYVLALRNTNKWGQQSEQVTYDLVQLDANGAQANNGMAMGYADGGSDYSVWGAKSLTAYETLFDQDFNGDNTVGIDASKLTSADTDKTGVKLARDSQGSLYVLDESGQAKAIGNAEYMEYDNSWGDGYSKREAVAVEALTDAQGAVTGYALAMRSANQWGTQKAQVTWDILSLDSNARVTHGSMTNGVWQDSTVWGTKSIAAYETTFNQDLNGDEAIGIDVTTLTAVDSDKFGVGLFKDKEGGLYAVGNVNDASVSTALSGPSLEWASAWGSGSNSRKAVAVEATTDASGNVLFKVALKNTNAWSGQDTQVTWDVLTFDAQGRQQNGSMTDGVWSDPNVWGAKSIATYETIFQQDLNADGNIGIDLSKLTAVATDTSGVRLRRDRDQALYLIDTVDGTSVARAVGDGQWLEYNNSWYGGSNRREAVAIEAHGDGYRLAMKQTNTWNGSTDESWEVLTLDALGRVTWSSTAASFTTRDVKQVEDAVRQDLDGDGMVGVTLSNLELVETDQSGARLAWANKGSGSETLYVLEGVTTSIGSDGAVTIQSVTTKVAVVDAAGATPQLEQSSDWLGGNSKSTVWAVAKQTLDDGSIVYLLAVKNERTSNGSTDTVVSWTFHTVSESGVLDWSKAVTTKTPGAYENLFGLDLDGDKTIGRLSSTKDLSAVATDVGNTVAYLDKAGSLYFKAQDTGSLYYAVDAKGAALSFNAVTADQISEVYAVSKRTDNSYLVAVKHTATSDDSSSWEVHSLAAANDQKEAVIDWTKTRYFDQVEFVEELLNQDIDGNGVAGFAVAAAQAVEGDMGLVRASVDGLGRVQIVDDVNAVTVTVHDALGARVVLASDESEVVDGVTYGYTQEVLAAEAQVIDQVTQYRLMVRSAQTEDGSLVSESFQVYTISDTGKLMKAVVDTPSPLAWEKLFGQDFNGDERAAGVIQEELVIAPTDADLATDSYGAVYVKLADSYAPVMDTMGGNMTFLESLAMVGYESQSSPFAAQLQANGDVALGVQTQTTIGGDSFSSYAVHTLAPSDTGDVLTWQSVEYVDDPTALADWFGSDVAGLVA